MTGLPREPALARRARVVDGANAFHAPAPAIQIGRERRCARIGGQVELVARIAAQPQFLVAVMRRLGLQFQLLGLGELQQLGEAAAASGCGCAIRAWLASTC